MTTIVLAEAHSLIRTGLRAVLESAPDLKILGEATDGRSAVEMADRLHPDILMINLNIPALSGLEAAQQMERNGSSVRVLITSIHSEPIYTAYAIRYGASGYLNLDSTCAEYLEAVRSVAHQPFRIHENARSARAEAELGRLNPHFRSRSLSMV